MSWLIYIIGIGLIFFGADFLEKKYGNKARKIFQEEPKKKVVNK